MWSGNETGGAELGEVSRVARVIVRQRGYNEQSEGKEAK
jgi:hypothetical protein